MAAAAPSRSQFRARPAVDDNDVMLMAVEQDGKWEPGFRRKLRQQYRDLLTDTQKRRDEITLPDELVKKMKECNDLYKDVVASREAVIDSEELRLLSEIGREQVESTHGELISFHTEEYAEKLVTFMGGRRGELDSRSGGGRLDWSCLGERARKAFRRTPTLSFLHGALEVQPVKKREKHGPSQRREPVQTKQLKEVCDLQEEEESTTKDVSHMLQHLKEACDEHGVHYFKFLVDPESFAHTVENMFHFSFLIKEGRAGMDIGEDGQPYIHLPEDANEVGQSNKKTKNQVIVSLNMEEWKRAIEKFKITEAYIPRRST